MSEFSDLFPSIADQPGQFPEIDAWLDRQASGWLKIARSRVDLLAEGWAAGWQVQEWGDSVFGQFSGSGPASLLVYIPPGRASRSNLAALLAAAQSWQTLAGELPLTLKFLMGKLDSALLDGHAADLAADAIVYAEGEYRQGRPLLSLGLKGLLEVELRVTTMSKDAPSAYSEIMPAASWLLVQAIAALKSDSQEVQIEDFEAGIAPFPAQESLALRQATPDFSPELAQRLKDYGLNGYIFNLGDWLVLQTQFMVPTVNVSALECGSFDRAGHLKLPATARARLDFHLVPYQDPDAVFESLKQHLLAKDFGPQLEIIQLPGALRPSRTPLTAPFIRAALAAFADATGQPPLVVPLVVPLVAPISVFSGPLALLKEALGSPPAICGGLGREKVSRADFSAHSRWLAHLLAAVADPRNSSFETYPDRPAEPFEIFSERPGDTGETDFELPDLSDLSILIPDLPEMEDDLFGSVPEHKPGNFSLF